MHTALEEALDRVFHFVLPAHCLGCRVALGWRSEPLELCPGCRAALVRADVEHCRLCGSVTATGAWLCVGCSLRPPAFDQFLAAWSYEAPVDEMIRAFKFGRREYLGQQIGEALAIELGEELDGHDLVTAVPLHWLRWWSRGFNQAELIAKSLAKSLGIPNRRLLRRRGWTKAQSGLGRGEREQNVRGAFRLRPTIAGLYRGQGIRLTGVRVLLVDDVATTAATVQAASLVLGEAGAEWISVVVAARTPFSKIPADRPP